MCQSRDIWLKIVLVVLNFNNRLGDIPPQPSFKYCQSDVDVLTPSLSRGLDTSRWDIIPYTTERPWLSYTYLIKWWWRISPRDDMQHDVIGAKIYHFYVEARCWYCRSVIDGEFLEDMKWPTSSVHSVITQFIGHRHLCHILHRFDNI